jgi:RNA 2',3'-cyclic 3'-phosphodiesterase
MNSRRIFIAINLPQGIIKKLGSFCDKWQDLPAKWTRPENLHITLAFIGYAEDDAIAEVCKATKKVAEIHKPFFVDFNKICYGPLGKQSSPRMVWVVGGKSEEFSLLRDDIERELLDSQKIRFLSEAREFSPHVTLARISQWEWKKIEPEERPLIDEDIDLSFDVSSIEVMESELKKGGPRYSVLGSYELNL